MDRKKLKVSKAVLTALRLLDERCRREQQEVINDFIVESGESLRGAWEMKEIDAETFLIRRGPEAVIKAEDGHGPYDRSARPGSGKDAEARPDHG
jgi:hypothetical protein